MRQSVVAAASLACAVLSQPALAIEGRVIEARTGAPLAGAEVTVLGHRGSARTDADGWFRWDAWPEPPVLVIVLLRDGRLARPIEIDRLDPSAVLVLQVEPAVSEAVTITGAAPTIDRAPGAAATLVSGEDVAMRHPATITETLENVPGAGAVAEGQAAVPSLRGLARGRTLILVDGSRAASERRAGPNASFLDPAQIQSLEVARGPGSVAYGSDAFGGIIAVRTRRPDHADPLRVTLVGTLGGGVPERRAELEASSGYGTGGILVAARARAFDDYASPEGMVPNSGWRDHGVMVRWQHDTGRNQWHVGWRSDLGRDLGRPRSDSAVIRVTSPYERSHRLNVTFHREGLAGFGRVRVDGLIGHADQRTEQDRLPDSTRSRRLDRADLSAWDAQLRVTGDRALGSARLQVGADVTGRYGVTAEDTTTSFNLAGAVTAIRENPSIESARRTNAAVFAQLDAPVARAMTASGGLRADVVRNVNTGGFFGDRAVLTGAVAGYGALSVGPFAGTTFTVQIARGFRDPTLSDRFYRGPVGRGFVQGNPDLRPETSLQLDVGARHVRRRLRAAAYYYEYRITDLVERYAAGAELFLFRNRGEARLRGGEVEAQLDLPRGFSIEAMAQASQGRGGDGAPLDDVPPRELAVVARHAGRWRLAWFVRLARVAPHRDAGPSEVATPGYGLVDAGGTWTIARHLEVRAVARNLANASYPSSAGPRWVLAPGRRGSITVVVTF